MEPFTGSVHDTLRYLVEGSTVSCMRVQERTCVVLAAYNPALYSDWEDYSKSYRMHSGGTLLFTTDDVPTACGRAAHTTPGYLVLLHEGKLII